MVGAWFFLSCVAHRTALGCVYHSINTHLWARLSVKLYKGSHQPGKSNLNAGPCSVLCRRYRSAPQENSLKEVLLSLFPFYTHVEAKEPTQGAGKGPSLDGGSHWALCGPRAHGFSDPLTTRTGSQGIRLQSPAWAILSRAFA